ncbi:MAG: TdeIII family type II restriction endonuclease [Candidatus Hatepunaea meridiana]|nr:TdeIII family type II restriction endonuclease [Candidatus Hatepunaea meridiana]
MLTKEQKNTVQRTIKTALRSRFTKYNPEPAVMPFHTRLLGNDRLALYSFIHSLNTSFGTSIFEPVAISLARNRYKIALRSVKAGNLISEAAQYVIQEIMDELTAANRKPDKLREIERIRSVCCQGEMRTVKPTVVDVYLETYDGELFLFDIKTAKPNKGGFKEFKRTMLEWAAIKLAENPDANINTLIAIPYNPYEPKPYSRWTMAGMLDLDNELKVAAEFWDFLGGEGAYEDLLLCFELVGIELRKEIDDYFARFNNS